jgi:hypothetical protein
MSAEDLSRRTAQIEQMFVRRGLPFLLEHPGRSTRAEMGKLAKRLLLVFCFLFIVLLVTFDAGSDDPSAGLTKLGQISYRQFYLASLYSAVAYVAGFVLLFTGWAFIPVLRSWARVGNSLALMLSFVTLYFLTGDAWRVLGRMDWWRLITFACVCATGVLALLYRHAGRAVRDTDHESRSDPAKFETAVARMFPGISAGPPDRQDLPQGGKAGLNLRSIVTLLFARRILVSGLLVFLALLFLGMVMIDQHAALSLMSAQSPAAAGWTATLGVGGHGFSVSEALVKVALSLGGLAAAYFVVITMTAEPGQARTTDETAFIQNVSALWSCYERRPTQPAN